MMEIYAYRFLYVYGGVDEQSLMAIREPLTAITTSSITTGSPKPRRVCFSFAAYAKNVIDHLKTCNVPVEEGLSDVEFSSIESTFNFKFPPDLRSILQEGLPVGPAFPNWRSSSSQQLEILTNLPILGISKEVSRHNFWVDSWGHKPEDLDEAVKLAKGFLKLAPVLVPIYRNCYIPSTPNFAGNPVFYIHGGDVKLLSFEVSGFFQRVDFRLKDLVMKRASFANLLKAPSWAATEARRIEFWTELVERGERVVERADTHWWSSGPLGKCLEQVCRKLRAGGWKEEEVREMTMMIDDGDGHDKENRVLRGKEGVVSHVRILSLMLLRAGWSTEDVVDSLGLHVENGLSDGESSFTFDIQRAVL
ncbi:hypothetical protein F0562_006137 [Nyssa sinensis]|uniref:Knr4/Smi1-like domain-containing protein n=1 Tax=Nyssa sinensis TaxID=561372 RepID=A0A5J5ALB2_9ASTE|nr:hypothetical protein F0562_006137 [Nyssa sinensis]